MTFLNFLWLCIIDFRLPNIMLIQFISIHRSKRIIVQWLKKESTVFWAFSKKRLSLSLLTFFIIDLISHYLRGLMCIASLHYPLRPISIFREFLIYSLELTSIDTRFFTMTIFDALLSEWFYHCHSYLTLFLISSCAYFVVVWAFTAELRTLENYWVEYYKQ